MQTNTFKVIANECFQKNANEYFQLNTYWQIYKNIKTDHVHVPWRRHGHYEYAYVDDLHRGVARQTRLQQTGLTVAQ